MAILWPSLASPVASLVKGTTWTTFGSPYVAADVSVSSQLEDDDPISATTNCPSAAWSEIPEDRFNVDAFHSHSDKVNTSITRGAHFLKQDVTKFDANFFSFSKAEADSMDPQHRMMIEVAYEALEKAGLSLQDVAGTRTGVFVGHFTSDYRELIFKE